MTWGALNNQKEKTPSEPLPDFLTGQSGKNFSDRTDHQFQNSDDIIVRPSERPQGVRKDSGRSYGVAYPAAINIQMTKKTLFVSLVFFVTVIILTFCTGYLAGNMSIVIEPVSQTSSLAPIKKPIIPVRKKLKQPTILEKKEETSASEKESILNQEDIEGENSSFEENTISVSSTNNKNNQKDKDSETLHNTAPSTTDADDMDN